ncbi:MAG: PadR family transcriptional regulator [Rhodopirellula sp.]|nr:PadR family transcriptional regulator [Rhodopirellula sp.]
MMSADEAKAVPEPLECPCEGGSLDKLIQPAILIVLSDGPLHGYGLAERLSEMPMFGGQRPDGAGVYRFLKSMEGKGFVASQWDTSQRGPARRSYEITADGECCLRKWLTTLEAYRDGINFLVRAARKATTK